MFRDRGEAGKLLAQALKKYRYKKVIVYGIPRGGVVTAWEIARFLRAPLDVVITRKIGHPGNLEYAIAALSENNGLVTNEEEVAQLDKDWLQEQIAEQKVEAKRRRRLYQPAGKKISAEGRVAILVDDGVATGLSIKAAVKELKYQKPTKIVVAVPVCPRDFAREIRPLVDELVALEIPEDFLGSVGSYYGEFPQVSDDEVVDLLI